MDGHLKTIKKIPYQSIILKNNTYIFLNFYYNLKFLNLSNDDIYTLFLYFKIVYFQLKKVTFTLQTYKNFIY